MSGDKGQTLIELIVVISVSVIVVGALVFAIIASLRNAQFAKYQTQATKLAQEGIEKVRIGRDRNRVINIPNSSVQSWNGNEAGAGAFWDYNINENWGALGASYFKLLRDEDLTYIASSPTFPTSGTEVFGQFKRAIVIEDITEGTDNYTNRKKVTSIVTWRDFSGPHESRLTTILRKIQ